MPVERASLGTFADNSHSPWAPGTHDVVFCRFGKTIQEMKDKFSLSSFYLDGRDGKRYYYTHLQSIAVKAGQQVKQGQVVGAIGAYNGKNAHLHLATKQGSPCDVLEACRPVDTRDCK
eukprot:GHRR01032190.1.p2 GENE.GHRR01032190.1~~GHRR01032190.1.p2  ORF type:complete len:118 (+),score=26.59 GHRR01032190.1:139-492(+)